MAAATRQSAKASAVQTSVDGAEGARRIAWARSRMDVLASIRSRLEEEQPFDGLRVGMALHVEAKTAVLALTLAAGGAEVRLASCNPQSTDDMVVAALPGADAGEGGVQVRARKGQDKAEYYAGLEWVLDGKPDLLVDDGGDLGLLAHGKRKDVLAGIRGASEETTTGVQRYRAMAKDGQLKFPVIDANGAQMKHLFDNRYGTGQSAFDGLLSATNLLVAGKEVVVAGYGWCGRGIATRARGLGATVTVTEVDPVKAIEARLDGHHVAPMAEACRSADFIITATGDKSIIDGRHVPLLKDGVVLANAGHFDHEVDKPSLQKDAATVEEVRRGVTQYLQRDGRRVCLVSDGRLVNLASGQGHPVEIMDMSFAIQALCVERLALGKGKKGALPPGVHQVPAEFDAEVAKLKLAAMGLRIDELTAAQRHYLESWGEGT